MDSACSPVCVDGVEEELDEVGYKFGDVWIRGTLDMPRAGTSWSDQFERGGCSEQGIHPKFAYFTSHILGRM